VEPWETEENGVTVVTHTSKVDRKWWAWAGSSVDLKSIGDTFEELARKGLDAQLALVQGKSSDADRERDEINERWKVQVAASNPTELKSLVGPLVQVLDKCNPKLVESFTLMTGKGKYDSSPQLLLTMKRRKDIDRSWDQPGIALHIEGRNYGWVREAGDRLSAAIRLNVPWWEFLRTPWIGRVVCAVIATLSGALIGAPFGVTAEISSASIAFDFGILVLPPIVRKMLPAFEVVSVGDRPNGTRIIGVIGGLVGQVAIGIVIALAFQKK
jgi:hypothetical protein